MFHDTWILDKVVGYIKGTSLPKDEMIQIGIHKMIELNRDFIKVEMLNYYQS